LSIFDPEAIIDTDSVTCRFVDALAHLPARCLRRKLLAPAPRANCHSYRSPPSSHLVLYYLLSAAAENCTGDVRRHRRHKDKASVHTTLIVVSCSWQGLPSTPEGKRPERELCTASDNGPALLSPAVLALSLAPHDTREW